MHTTAFARFLTLSALLCLGGLTGCSSGGGGDDDSGTCARGCSAHADCARGQYCSEEGCCLAGCAFDQDCDGAHCDLATHACTGGPDGSQDDGEDGSQGGDDGGQGGDDGGQTTDGGGDQDCPATHDQPLGAECACNDECVAEAPYCFADVMNDSGPLYCTISFATQSCEGQTCPAGYQCNDFYVQADPPQPPFCQKCLGGPLALGQTCLCDSDCAPEAPDCFKDLMAAEGTTATCTLTGCTTGAADSCPGTFECTASFDMQAQTTTYYCKACSPGDHSLADGAECGCNKDCLENSICTKDLLSQDPKTCVACLGGAPRPFGETCACDADCGPDYPTCLVSSDYCSKLSCTGDQDCPPEGHCKDVLGIFTFCEKD